MLKRGGPRIDPCGMPNNISDQELQLLSIFALYFLFDKLSWINRNAVRVNPYALSFALSNSWSRQSNAFERSVSKAPKALSLSTEFFHFSNKSETQCCVLYPYWNPHCWSNKNLSK